MIYYLTNGVIFMLKGIPNKRYTPEFKKLVVETMMKEKLSYRETARQFEISDAKRIAAWERIYLTEGQEGFAGERRGRGSKGHPPKQLPKEVEEDLLAEVQRLRAENDYLKKLASLGFGRRATPAQKTQVVQKLRQRGNCLDNAVIENFFGLLKSELLYLQEFQSMEHFKQKLVEYLDYYNNRRIKAKRKGLLPAIHRQQALSAA